MNDQRHPAEPTESQFARRTRELREKLGMSQAVLAMTLTVGHDVKINDSTVTKIEKGDRSIRLNEAAAIANVFGMTLDEMLRPALPVADQIRQAEQHVARTEWLAAQALAEHAAAKARLERLVGLAKKHGDDHGR